MDLSSFSQLPDESRVWIHGFGEQLSSRDEETIRKQLAGFMPHWMSHNEMVSGAFDTFHQRFLVTAAHCSGGISGCSTDSFVREIKALRDDFELDGLDTSLVYFRNADGRVEAVPHLDFFEVAASGRIQPDTPVFDTLLNHLGQLRQGQFEKPFQQSWHARVYPLETAAK